MSNALNQTRQPAEVFEHEMAEDTAASPIARLFLQEDLNFLVTNRIPRKLATRLAARFGRIRSPRLTKATIALWQFFADDLRLEESATQEFDCLHDCFTRALKPGARPIDADPQVLVSPCDAIVGAHGAVRGREVIQAKGLSYAVSDLFADSELAHAHRDGLFITLRLQANMYHRFHAPCAGTVTGVDYIAGDTWNVNPIALERVERLFCRNERAVVDIAPTWPGTRVALVPVAAILVGGIRFNFIEMPLDLRHRGLRHFDATAPLAKGAEIGRFEAGSTIILFASGPFRFAEGITEGRILRVGQPLLRYQPPADRAENSDRRLSGDA